MTSETVKESSTALLIPMKVCLGMGNSTDKESSLTSQETSMRVSLRTIKGLDLVLASTPTKMATLTETYTLETGKPRRDMALEHLPPKMEQNTSVKNGKMENLMEKP